MLWPFDGFEGSATNAKPGKYVEEKAGQTINIMFYLGGDRGMNILADGSPYNQQRQLRGLPREGAEEEGEASARHAKALALGEDFDDLKYNSAKKEYTFKWKTDKTWKGTCRMLMVALVDNSVHTAVVKFG